MKKISKVDDNLWKLSDAFADVRAACAGSGRRNQ